MLRHAVASLLAAALIAAPAVEAKTLRWASQGDILTFDFHAAADGQLGGILKIHRDWRISGDTAWLRGLWPKVRKSLDYCIETWDPGRKGWLEEPHHNTYDIEFWGPDGMCTSFYLGALKAALLYPIARLYGYCGHADALLFALGLSQVGEFAFVLFAAAGALLPRETLDVLNAAVAASMLTTPLLVVASPYELTTTKSTWSGRAISRTRSPSKES